MFDFKNVDMVALKTDLLKNVVVIIVARVLKFYLSEGGQGDLLAVLTSQEFIYSMVFVLVGFTAFHVLAHPTAKKAKLLTA